MTANRSAADSRRCCDVVPLPTVTVMSQPCSAPWADRRPHPLDDREFAPASRKPDTAGELIGTTPFAGTDNHDTRGDVEPTPTWGRLHHPDEELRSALSLGTVARHCRPAAHRSPVSNSPRN